MYLAVSISLMSGGEYDLRSVRWKITSLTAGPRDLERINFFGSHLKEAYRESLE